MSNLSTLVNFNHAYMSYRDFLFNQPNTLRDNPESIKMLETLFTCLNIILNQDRINTKDENESNYISKEILDQLISVICTKRNNTYYLGNLQFSSPDEIIKIIRNKIAHGEYSIDKDVNNILFPLEQETITIPTKALYNFTLLLIERLELHTTTSQYNRTQIVGSVINHQRITKERHINQFLDNIYYIDYTFYGNPNLTPTDKYKIEEILKQIPIVINNQNRVLNPKEIEYLINQIFFNNNIKLRLIIKPLSQTHQANDLTRFIISNFQTIEQMDLRTQTVLISNWFQKLLNDNKTLENICNGIHYNLLTLDSVERLNAKTSLDTMKEIKSNNLFSSIVEMALSTELLGFYVHFQYPLENICKSKDNTEDGLDYFDYSRLDLSMLQPAIFHLPVGRQSSFNEAVTASTKRLNLLNIEINKLQKQLDNIKTLAVAASEEEKSKYEIGLNRVTEKLEQVIEKQNAELELLTERERQLNEFNTEENNSYYYNRYLIEYIRNAISHGNVHFYYSETNASLQSCILRFINQKDGKVTLDLSVSIADFEKIFGPYNLRVLDEYLTENKKGKKH